MSSRRRGAGDDSAGGAGPLADGDLWTYVRLAMLALLVGSVAWGGVRLTDPLPKAPGASPVEVDAPPARVAYQAMVQTEQGRYVVERYTGNDTHLEQFLTLRVDAPDRQVRGTIIRRPVDGPSLTREAYGSEAGTWYRDRRNGTPASPWRIDVPYSPSVFGHEAVVLEGGADISVVSSNVSTLVVRVNDTDTAFRLARGWENVTGQDPDRRGSLTLAIDRRVGVLRWSRFRQSRLRGEEGNGTRVVTVSVLRFDRWGEVDVRTPPALPHGFDTVVSNLANDCPECEEGE